MSVCVLAVSLLFAVPHSPANPNSQSVVVESGAGSTLEQSDPVVMDSNGGGTYRPGNEAPTITCVKHAARLFGGDRKQAVHLCKGGTGSMERIHCAEQLVRYLTGSWEDVARACTDGGTPATSQCVINAARLFQGSYAAAINLCVHGGTPENVRCAKDGLIVLGGDQDEVIELCHNLRMPRSE